MTPRKQVDEVLYFHLESIKTNKKPEEIAEMKGTFMALKESLIERMEWLEEIEKKYYELRFFMEQKEKL